MSFLIDTKERFDKFVSTLTKEQMIELKYFLSRTAIIDREIQVRILNQYLIDEAS